MVSPLRPPPARERGQATVEYAGLVGIVALLMAVAVAVGSATGITGAVIREFKRALCIVSGHGCTTMTLVPCQIGTANTGVDATASIAIVKLGGKATFGLIEMSDGKVDVVQIDEGRAAATGAIGEEAHLDLGSTHLHEGLEAEASAGATLAYKRVWHAKNRDQADHILQQVVKQFGVDTGTQSIPVVGSLLHLGAHVAGLDHVPGPDLVGIQAGVEGVAKAGLPAGALGVDVAASAGGTLDKSGTKTLAFVVDHQGSVSLGSVLGLTLAGQATATLQLSWDHDNRPLGLKVILAGQLGDTLGLSSPEASESAGSSVSAAGGQASGARGQLAATLSFDPDEDLDGANLAAARTLLHGLDPAHAGELPGALAGLGERLVEDSRLDFTRYGTKDQNYGGGAEAALGAKLGLGAEITHSSTRLLDAWSRLPGEQWLRRLDCLSAVRA